MVSSQLQTAHPIQQHAPGMGMQDSTHAVTLRKLWKTHPESTPLQCSLPAGEEGGETGTEEGGEAGTEEGGEATTEEGGEATTEEGGEATTEEGGEAVEMMNIVDTAVAAGDFTTLVAAVTAADLAATLSDESAEFTVFAPTDAAFDALPEGTVDGLLADIPALTDILLYHVVAGKVPAADVLGLTSAATLQGSNVSIKVEGGEVFLNDTVKVTTTDIMCTNGIIHVIDGVLIPAE